MVSASDPFGELEGVAIYGRYFNSAEAKQHYTLYADRLQGREDPPQLELDAKLVARSAVPSEQDMGIYSRAMVANEYEVQRVHEGSYEGDTIVVQQWAVADRKPAGGGEEYAYTGPEDLPQEINDPVLDQLSDEKKREMIDQLEEEMHEAADQLAFERAAELRDTIDELKDALPEYEEESTEA